MLVELEQRITTSEAMADHAAQAVNLPAIHLLTAGSMPPPIRMRLSHFAIALEARAGLRDHDGARRMHDALRAIGGDSGNG